MNKEKIIFVDPSTLLKGPNSRWRVDENLSELMEAIKQEGIIQPICARSEDRKIICGNRRMAAATKLGLNLVPVRFIPNVSDKHLLIMNLQENMQRKDISSIEIGRQADEMLKNAKFKISLSELAVSLGVSDNRIKICLDAFKRLPEIYRKNVVHLDSARKRKFGDLPESIVKAILYWGRCYKSIDGHEMDLLLRESIDKKLTLSQIALIGKLFTGGMPLKMALKEVNLYTIARVNFVLLKTELSSVQKKEQTDGKQALFNKILRRVYPNLLY